MNNKYFHLSLLLTLGLFPSLNYAQSFDDTKEEQHQRFDYRRIDQNNLPPIEKYAQSKEQVFPLGYDTNHLNKLITGTGVWTELNPKVPRVTYIGLHFVNKDTGWACGMSGAIIKTTNGGNDWTISETPINNILLKIHSYNGQVVIATGWDGIILRSSDTGESFVQVASGVGNDLWGIQMLNDTLGWVSGAYQTLVKTTDAGLTWQFVNAGLNQHYWSLNFLNDQYGIIPCNDGKILKTTNGGNNWSQIQAGDTRALYTIDIIDSQHIVAAGDNGKNVYSSDGGITWISNPDIPAFSSTNWIDFIDADLGYSVQDGYGIRKTTNRGQNWFSVLSAYEDCEWHIQLLEDGTGYACGEEAGWIYTLNFYKRTNGLDNWDKIFLNYNWSDVFFINENKGFIISSNLGAGLYKTENGGVSYQKMENAPIGYDLLYLDSLTGFIAGTHKTTDGGETWYQINAGGGTKVFFINDSIGWSIDSHIYKTTDGGENWIVQLSLPADYFTSIFFIDTLNGWATSRYIWQTTNGGNYWLQQNYLPNDSHDDVYFMNKDTGWISMYSSITPSLYITTNTGANWSPVIEVIGARKFRFFPDPLHWFIIGWSRYYETINSGQTWSEFTSDVPTGITSFDAPTNTIGYAVGSGGLILKYYDTTYVPVELISFEGRIENNEIVLSWITASELNNQGFYIQKSFDEKIWVDIGFIVGRGNTNEINYYTFNDNKITSSIQFYRLKQVNFDGTYNYSKEIRIVIEFTPKKFSLSQNYPNPFNPNTKIKFTIPVVETHRDASLITTLKVFDILGREVATLINEEKTTGEYEVEFNSDNIPSRQGSTLTSGIYFYQLHFGEYRETKKMILLK